ncbi:tetratricopeptide repeat protein [Streptomyces roseirectus]|uniref:Tetratricopeptide repeat protein n=1 Tax=Streptomyces roseirectus TaxID=2768066 RepID=A0A7H0IS95_9ACTN|nr:tetratricopeptide repeat protein [Streptomyces roseirectus]
MLGPVELHGNQQIDTLGSTRDGLIVGCLALDAGRPVSTDSLIHRLWDDTPPARPLANLYTYVARVRRRLRDLGAEGCLVQRTHGYLLDLDPDRVDSHRFQHLVAQARALSDRGADQQALRLLGEADALWLGEPLAGLPGLWAEGVRGVLTERRLAAQLIRADIGLREGHFADLVPDLTALAEEHRTDEAIAARLMTAAYGCGRLTDALRVYDTVRRRLAGELGADPGEALARLHHLILNSAPVEALLNRPEPTVPAPRTLPSHAELVGREAELSTIVQHATRASADTSAPRHIIALQTVSGMAGVGKTVLALNAADRIASLYPDGVVHLDLRTHAPGQQPLTVISALTSLIRAFGVPASALPGDPDALTALWRGLLDTRRAVVILDDVRDARQLRDLLPGPSPSLVLVTSRRRLTGLPGLRSVDLDVLPAADALALFRSVAGHERTRQTGEVADIVRLAGFLPLGIELLAGRLASRPTWTTSHLLRRLTQGQGRLREIRDGARGNIAAAFDVSFRALESVERKVFRFLGLRFGPTIDAYAVAALTDLPLDTAENVLESLLEAHLIQEPSPERYTLHDLLGEYARAIAMSEESNAAREEALSRLAEFCLQAADAADRLAYPRRLRTDRAHSAGRPVPPWGDATAARDWLAAERIGLMAAERHCRTTGHSRLAALLASALAAFLDDDGHSAEGWRMHAAATEHWRESDDRHREIHALIDLGNALTCCSRYEDARTAYTRALTAAEETSDPESGAETLHQLGILYWHLGDFRQALAYQSRTLALHAATGDDWQLARCRSNLGITHLYLGDFTESEKNLEAALDGFREARDLRRYARTLINLSDLHLRTERKDTAREFLDEALTILTEMRIPAEIAGTQVNLANTMESPRDLTKMLDLYQDSLTTFRRLGDRRNAAETLYAMGSALHAAHRFTEAADRHRHSLELARSVGAVHETAQALHALALAEQQLGQLDAAADHLTEAITLAERTGAAHEAAEARKSLTKLRRAQKERPQ